MFSTPIPSDINALQQLLLSETHLKDQALAKITTLEEEIAALKKVLATQALSEAEKSNTAPTERKFNGELILIVDDQQLNLDLVASLLEDEHLTIVCKPSAFEALDYLRSAQPAVILMDIQMPGMDGFGATEKIRTEFPDYNPTILAMTANDTDEDRKKSTDAGMQGHICKPIDAEYLLDQLAYWLHQPPQKLDEHRQNIQSGAASLAPLPPDETRAQIEVKAELSPEKSAPLHPINSGAEELNGIDLPSAMARLRGNRKLLDEVLISFAEKAALIIPELRAAISENNDIETTRILHRLKGTSANLSAYKIAPLAALLETQCKAGQMPNEEELLKLDAVVNEIIATAVQLAGTKAAPVPSGQVVSLSHIEPLLKDISAHLHSDLGLAEEAIEALCALCAQTNWAESAAKLRTLFYQFNLRAVNELISHGFKDSSL